MVLSYLWLTDEFFLMSFIFIIVLVAGPGISERLLDVKYFRLITFFFSNLLERLLEFLSYSVDWACLALNDCIGLSSLPRYTSIFLILLTSLVLFKFWCLDEKQ